MKQPLYFAAYLAVLGMLVTAVAIAGYNLAAPKIEENRQDKIRENVALLFVIYDMQTAGRNGTINALVAVDPYSDTVIGAVYYNHSETPGKGALYGEEDEIAKIIGDSVLLVEFDVKASVSTTYNALRVMYDAIAEHYTSEEVHIDG